MKLPFPNTLKGQLTIWYVATLLIFMLFAVVVFGSLIWATLYQQIDHHIHVVVIEASNIIATSDVAKQTEALRNLVSEKGMTAVLMAPDGKVTVETNGPEIAAAAERQLVGALSTSSHDHAQMMHFTVGDIRFAAVPVNQPAGDGVLAIGYSTLVIRDTLLQMVVIVVGILTALLVPFTLIGVSLLNRSLRPLEEVSRRAASVTRSSDLSVRMSDVTMSRELGTIASSLDSLLSRMQTIFDSEHAFFSDAAHTLKTPLAVLRSQVETLTNVSVAKKQQLLTTIDRCAENIADLLLISRLETAGNGKYKSISLTDIAFEVTELGKTLGETKRIQVEANISPTLDVTADASMLRRALTNVVHNAVLYSPVGGRVTIALVASGDKVVFSITNEGKGISKTELAKIFTRFYRASSSRGVAGSGLGLAITKAIVENYGGTISITSNPGKITTVTITLPRAA